MKKEQFQARRESSQGYLLSTTKRGLEAATEEGADSAQSHTVGNRPCMESVKAYSTSKENSPLPKYDRTKNWLFSISRNSIDFHIHLPPAAHTQISGHPVCPAVVLRNSSVVRSACPVTNNILLRTVDNAYLITKSVDDWGRGGERKERGCPQQQQQLQRQQQLQYQQQLQLQLQQQQQLQ